MMRDVSENKAPSHEIGARGHGLAKHRLLLLASALLLSLAAGLPSARAAGDFEKKWGQLIENAKKEGRVVIAAGGQPSRNYRPLMMAFEKRFGIPAEMSTGNARVTVNRVLAERRARKFTVDVGLIAHNSAQRRLVPAKALVPIERWFIHPEVTDKSHWQNHRYHYADPDQKYVFIYTARPENSWRFWYNTKKITEAEISTIKTLDDFLDPKWSGKIATLGITDPSGLADFIHLYVAPDAGPSWVRKYLLKTKITYVDERRVLETWLTKGRFPLQFPPASREELLELAKAGVPVKEGTIPMKLPGLKLGGSSCCIEAFDRPPHPHAARLFVNWFLSREGQSQLHKIEWFEVASLRDDIDYGKILPDAHRRRGVTYRFDEAEPWRAKAATAAVKQIKKWWESKRKSR